MKTIKYFVPWLAAATIDGAIAVAPIANADTDPAVPYGTNPTSPAIFGYHTSNDVANPTNSEVDVPF
jgi:hypothetical protein